MVRKSVLIITLLVIIGSLLMMACHPPPAASCSQGFWKNRGYKLFNHIWDYNRDFLNAKGPGSEAIRDAMTLRLNQYFYWYDADDYCLD